MQFTTALVAIVAAASSVVAAPTPSQHGSSNPHGVMSDIHFTSSGQFSGFWLFKLNNKQCDPLYVTNDAGTGAIKGKSSSILNCNGFSDFSSEWNAGGWTTIGMQYHRAGKPTVVYFAGISDSESNARTTKTMTSWNPTK